MKYVSILVDSRNVRFGWKRTLDLIYQDVERILELPEVTSVAAEYTVLDHLIAFKYFSHDKPTSTMVE